MRIRELLEGKDFDDSEFVTPSDKGRELNFDLAEDLMHFMHNDDDIYRRLLYPKIAVCLDHTEAKKSINPKIFKSAVEESYKLYIRKFPIRELPDEIDSELCEQVCDKMRDEFDEHISDGKYKD
jgi:hypothetical protein